MNLYEHTIIARQDASPSEIKQLIEKYSNGFKIRGTDNVTNANGKNYLFMAFGQSMVGSNNIPATAR